MFHFWEEARRALQRAQAPGKLIVTPCVNDDCERRCRSPLPAAHQPPHPKKVLWNSWSKRLRAQVIAIEVLGPSQCYLQHIHRSLREDRVWTPEPKRERSRGCVRL